MIDQGKNLMIGLFVIAAGTIILFILLFIHPMVGDDGHRFHVRFANIDKVNVGTRVTFGGKPVGEVIEIKEIIDKPDPRTPYEGYIYVYELTLAVDSSINIYNSDEVSLKTSGLLGEKSVNITPLPPKPGQELVLMDNQIIYAYESASMEDAFKEIKNLSNKIDTALNGVIQILDDVNKKELVAHITETFKNLEDITGSMNKPAEWSDIVDNVHQLTQNVVDSWSKVDDVITAIQKGEGTVGKLVMTDELYLRVASLFNKAETILNDINHYGVLFHVDKNWQRLRARRLNMLQKLSTPQDFRNFFNDEVDEITTSLARVSMLLERTNSCSTTCPSLVNDMEFSKVFSELLRRVDGLEEQLRMYNIQLNDYRVQETELNNCCECR